MSTNSIILLKIVSDNGSLLPLRQRGLAPSQIAMLVDQEVNAGNLVASIKGIKLTQRGEQILTQHYKDQRVSGPDQWILPQKCYYHEPLKEKTIVLPRKIK